MFGIKKSSAPHTIARNVLMIVMKDDDDTTYSFRIHPEFVDNAPSAGLIFADAAIHMAQAIAQSGKADSPEAALEQIRFLFNAELDHPTGTTHGNFTQ